MLAYAYLSGPFDYNKMPLAPMGCEAQVHEKTNKCGTWAYHLVDGWYLFTSPEHYCTHNCHISHTKSKKLSNTIQFQHKCITNPTITHVNKVMLALADCIKALQGMTGSARNSQAAQDLQGIEGMSLGGGTSACQHMFNSIPPHNWRTRTHTHTHTPATNH